MWMKTCLVPNHSQAELLLSNVDIHILWYTFSFRVVIEICYFTVVDGLNVYFFNFVSLTLRIFLKFGAMKLILL